MTTGNAIETYQADSVLFIPLEAVNGADGVSFVYQENGGGIVKQQIVTGAMNDDEAIVLQGLEENDRVLLAPPPNGDKLELVRLPGMPADTTAAGGDTTLKVPLDSARRK
jgi:hypothetical protein